MVAIVGRPNVGKSTLFNRLTETRQAIISDEAGTTRDRQYGRCQWCGKEFSLVDTGGWVRNSDDVFEEAICDQVTLALEEADVILFVVDAMNGLTDLDMEMASMLRRSKSITSASSSASVTWSHIASSKTSSELRTQPPVSTRENSLPHHWQRPY